MAEMWTRSPIMQGNTEQHQLTLIAQLCGAITPEVWPGVEKLDLFNKMELPKGNFLNFRAKIETLIKLFGLQILYGNSFQLFLYIQY